MNAVKNEEEMQQKECKWYVVCPIKQFTEQGKLDKKWTKIYCHNNWGSCIRYQKEEAGIFHPDNMLPDGSVNKKL